MAQGSENDKYVPYFMKTKFAWDEIRPFSDINYSSECKQQSLQSEARRAHRLAAA